MLQLGVTMDFSIFLLHRYQEEKELRSSNEEAMVTAICKTMTSITASSLTTIAGFLALCAMRLTLGRDIGLVMAKGVALGVICTVVILPSLILTFDKWVEKYKHRTVIPRLTKLSYFVSKHSVPIVAVFILILIPLPLRRTRPACTTPCSTPCPRPDRHRGHQQAGRGLWHDHLPLYSGG